MNNKLKVSLIGHTYLAKENQKCITVLTKHVDVEVVSPNKSSGMIFNYDTEINRKKIGDWTLNVFKKINIPLLPDSVYVLKSKDLNFNSFNPDIIHIETDPFHPVFLQSLISSFFLKHKVGIVATIKQNTYTSKNFFYDFLKDSLAKLLSRKVDKFIAVNEGVSRLYQDRFSVPESKIELCTHLGVDVSIFRPLSSKTTSLPIIIGYCGRIVQYKGIWELMRVVSKLNLDHNSQFELHLLGDGPDLVKVKEYIKDKPWIKLLSPIPHAKVAGFLNTLDIFVMPSRILKDHVEHDSHAVLEAMASGLPCIAAKSGSNIEVLEGIGILIEPENEQELLRAIQNLANDMGLRKKLGEMGRKRVLEKYSLDAVASKYFAVYKSI